MVSCILVGGLANNLFIMAATIAHSIKHGFNYVIPSEIENPHYKGQGVYRSSFINYVATVPGNLVEYKEPSLNYTEIPAINNIFLFGYFQSYKYFDFCIDDIRKIFNFKYERKDGITAIHVRRGDYLKLPHYNAFCGATYFRRAIIEMNVRGFHKFEVYSDDIAWCKEYFTKKIFTEVNKFKFMEGGNAVQDLENASGCQNQIMSNSAYSLWQHYLNQHPNKICTAPTIWFGDQIKGDTQDLYPPNCIKIPNERSEAFEQAR